MAKVKINFSIDSLAEGAGKELIERELSDIFNNINDPNADPTKKRSLIVKVDFVPDADYDEVKASINVSSKLAPAVPVTTKIMTGRDLNTGMIAASELKSGVKGQTYIDDKGDVRTDTGEKVEDVEKKSNKIIDLQEKRG